MVMSCSTPKRMSSTPSRHSSTERSGTITIRSGRALLTTQQQPQLPADSDEPVRIAPADPECLPGQQDGTTSPKPPTRNQPVDDVTARRAEATTAVDRKAGILRRATLQPGHPSAQQAVPRPSNNTHTTARAGEEPGRPSSRSERTSRTAFTRLFRPTPPTPNRAVAAAVAHPRSKRSGTSLCPGHLASSKPTPTSTPTPLLFVPPSSRWPSGR